MAPVVVALVTIVDDAFIVPKFEVVAFIVVPWNKVTAITLEFKLMALPEAVVFVPLPKVIMGEVVAMITPLGERARKFPAVGPARYVAPVVVALVTIVEEAFKIPGTKRLVVEAVPDTSNV